MPGRILVAREVAAALADGAPVVALESTIISHGLPRPDNLDVARAVERTVRAAGAVPATIALLDGVVHVGLDDRGLERIAGGSRIEKASLRIEKASLRTEKASLRTEKASLRIEKASLRDLAVVAARQGNGATTVAATAHLAARAGIAVFATGGLGGVHRRARDTWDESADLQVLSETPIAVVCAGVKSILDVGATLERLETLNVTVLGYGTHRFPGFYLTDSGYPVQWRVDTPDDVAAVMHAAAGLGTERHGLVVANPLPADQQVDPTRHDQALASALAAAEAAGVRGKDVTPFLLDHFHRFTGGESLRANIAIIDRNAALAAAIAVAHAG